MIPRTRRDDIKAIRLKNKTVELKPHQYFCETTQAFEIWQVIEGQEKMVERILRKLVVTLHKK